MTVLKIAICLSILTLVGIRLYRIPAVRTRMQRYLSATKTGTVPWATGYLWTILFALAGVAVFYWGLYKPGLRFSQVGDWAWDNWLWLLVFGGIVFALIKLNEKALGVETAKMLRSTLAGALFLMFIGVSAGIWVRDVFLPQVICKDGNLSEVSTCRLNTAWSTMFRAAEGRAADGANLCISPSSMVEYDYLVRDGTSFYRLRSKEGVVEVKYIFKKLPPGAKKCPEI